jgi:hypothetical protein
MRLWCLPTAVLMVLCDGSVAVGLTAHTMQYGVCAACVLAVHLWICSELESDCYLVTFIWLVKLAPPCCHLTSGLKL